MRTAFQEWAAIIVLLIGGAAALLMATALGAAVLR